MGHVPLIVCGFFCIAWLIESNIIILAETQSMELPASMMEPVEKALDDRAKELRDLGNKYSTKDSIEDALKESILIRRKE